MKIDWKYQLQQYGVALVTAISIFAALSLYIFYRRGYYDLYIANKAFAGDAAILLLVIFVLGPFSRFFNIFDKYLQSRKEIGITAFFLALAHSVISLFFLPGKFSLARYFSGLNWPFIFGLLGILVLIFLFLLSFKRLETWLGDVRWWKLQNWGLRLTVALVVLHVFVMKFPGWLKWYQVGSEPGLARPGLPGASLLLAWLMFFALLIRFAEFGGMKFGRIVSYLSLVFLPLIYLATFWWGGLSVAKVEFCLTRIQVEEAVSKENKCLVIYESKIYDLTLARKWNLTGHVGKHLCGKEYSREIIEKGPHSVAVMDKFLLTKLCEAK